MEMIRTPLNDFGTAGLATAETLSEKPVEKKRILVYDYDSASSSLVTECLAGEPYELSYCRDFIDLDSRDIDLLLWGLNSPCEAGIDALKVFRLANPLVRIVLLAPQEALAFASSIKGFNVESMILKPLHAQDIRSCVERALRKVRALEPATLARLTPFTGVGNVSIPRPEDLREDGSLLGLIGSSPEMLKVAALVRKVAKSNVNVLITGESGSGKEMVATAIHRASDRAGKPFVAINCAAIPRELLESELFGHAKGAFTGATTARRGLFEEAHEGTLLLDEIGDLPLPLQAKILRLLQTRQVKPLGQNAVKEVDVRIISATHKNLKALIKKGEFREDLYYRLNVMPICLPALRERKDDIVQLAEFFLRRYSDRFRTPLKGLTRKACQKLQSLPWKGNVRELENVIERAIVLADGDVITEQEILAEEAEPMHVTTEDLFNSGMTLKDIEREYIKYVLARVGNRKETATRILGIDRKTLYRKEKLYGIRPPSDMI